jgi:hypothetical protein
MFCNVENIVVLQAAGTEADLNLFNLPSHCLSCLQVDSIVAIKGIFSRD